MHLQSSYTAAPQVVHYIVVHYKFPEFRRDYEIHFILTIHAQYLIALRLVELDTSSSCLIIQGTGSWYSLASKSKVRALYWLRKYARIRILSGRGSK